MRGLYTCGVLDYFMDNGITFEKVFDLETQPGEFSYPSIVCRENRLLIVYTHNRKKIAFCDVEL